MNSEELNILQWNCQGFFSKKEEITQLLAEFDILILNETLLNEDSLKYVKFKTHEVIHLTNISGKNGSSIIFTKNLKHTIINFDNTSLDFEILGISLETTLGFINIISYYRSPSLNYPNNFWTDFINLIQPFKQNLILCGDFNLHNTYWG